jgi:uncharacterized membrane protein
MRTRQLKGARRESERGAVLIFVAFSMVMFIAACAISVDVGRVIVVNRSLQTVADAGALDAARYLDISGVTNARLTTQAEAAATANGSNATVTAVEGTLSGGTFTAGAGQFVKVTAASTLSHLFEPGSSSLSRFAIAEAAPPNAGFSIGTDLLSFTSTNSAVLNPLLSTLGTSVSFTAVGYQGMASTNVTVQQLIDASGGLLTPSNVLNTSLTTAQWDQIISTAVGSQAALLTCTGASPPATCAANTAFTTQGPFGGASFSTTLCKMVSIDGSTCTSTLPTSALNASVNVLQTLTTEAELANGTNSLTVNLGLGALTSLSITLGQIPQVAYGPVGNGTTTMAKTGQVNVTLSVLGLITVAVTGATGTADLTSINCTNNAMTQTGITAGTTTATAGVTILGLGGGLTNTTLTGKANQVYDFSPPLPSSTTIGTTSPTFSGLTSLLNLSGLTSAILNPVLQSLGVSAANAVVTDLSASCSPVELAG